MKKINVYPHKVLTSELAIHNPEKLQEYYSRINTGEEVMPVCVMNPNNYSCAQYKRELEKNEPKLIRINKGQFTY